jgi:HlyD family secretion protein
MKIASFISACKNLVRRDRGLAKLVAFTALFIAVIGWKVVWPAYLNPHNRMYTSKLGYPAVMRKLGRPLPVVTATVERRTFVEPMLGEGTMASTPVLVPVVPMDRITAVHVADGDVVKAGQLLAELDTSKIDLQIESAKVAVATATAELERVKIGSAYVLAQERPEKDTITLNAATNNAKLGEEKLKMYRDLFQKGIVSKAKLIEIEREGTDLISNFELAKLYLQMSSQGQKQSLSIAENAVTDARAALDHRLAQLKDFKIFAPAAGVVERVLIQPGEYNQDSGKPGFVLSTGLWFEAHLDQGAIAKVGPGTEAEVSLEAYPGRRFAGRVTKVIPVVTFNQGGPESNRPVRPLGTGAPEWPATFKVRIALDATDTAHIVPGMTGFARVIARQETLAVPRGAVLSVSAGEGIIYVINAQRAPELRQVQVGGSHLQIVDGLRAGETIIVDGQQVLQPTDKIRITAHRAALPSPTLAANGVGKRM